MDPSHWLAVFAHRSGGCRGAVVVAPPPAPVAVVVAPLAVVPALAPPPDEVEPVSAMQRPSSPQIRPAAQSVSFVQPALGDSADEQATSGARGTENMAVIARGAMPRRSVRGEKIMMVGDLSSFERRSV